MKTVSGKVVSTKPLSLSQAATVLSTFAAAETGASQAVSTYLRRASASFNELVQFHKELNASRSDLKHNKNRLENINNENPIIFQQNFKEAKIGQNIEDSEGKREKKRKKKNAEDVEREGGDNLGIEKEGRKERKKRKSGDIDDGQRSPRPFSRCLKIGLIGFNKGKNQQLHKFQSICKGRKSERFFHGVDFIHSAILFTARNNVYFQESQFYLGPSESLQHRGGLDWSLQDFFIYFA
ncbi:hypothetical protein F0562_001450 [Nyssa sinensis]|uniref:Uncharacterized protein n=1 Tax=Nyssa sinensis TaxID=561372 RepID=A0A5J5C6E8_9ASTE|nr:hypothetical protein F0562_001450 [Nyssa sinensis]